MMTMCRSAWGRCGWFVVCAATALLGQNAAAQVGVVPAGHVRDSVFRDCPECPEMVVIPTGNFTMGSSADEQAWASTHGARPQWVSDESPQHDVSVRSFALGRYDVTRGEFATFVRQTGYSVPNGCAETGDPKSKLLATASWQSPGFSQTDRDPVVCIGWGDARAYIAWLNQKVHGSSRAASSGPYRLPTETEWEYAARAGSRTRFWWGDDDSTAIAHAWYAANADRRTHPVGMMPPNAFGLYDMVGNVWQWTADCYAETYAGAPVDGSAATGPMACLRSDRGGSWFYPAWLLRSATRERNPASYRDGVMGFRVARTLP